MEDEALTQGEGERQVVVGERPALGHLRLDLALGILGTDLVEDHEGVVARDNGRGPDRVEAGEVGLRDDAQHARRTTLRAHHCGSGYAGCRCGHDAASVDHRRLQK
jgi:hypothetical protein